MPWNMIASATTPATRIVENSVSPEPLPPTPCPILGNTYVKTKTSRNGWSSVRGMNSLSCLRRTTASRSSRARNATRVAAAGLRRGTSASRPASKATALISSRSRPSGPGRLGPARYSPGYPAPHAHSFAQVLSGEVDEDGLERRLGDRHVGDVDAVALGHAEHLRHDPRGTT